MDTIKTLDPNKWIQPAYGKLTSMFTSTTIDLETSDKSMYTMLHSFYVYRYVVNIPLNTEHVLHTFRTYSQIYFQNIKNRKLISMLAVQ